MLHNVDLEHLGIRCLEAPTAEQAEINAKKIWPNNKVLGVTPAVPISETVSEILFDTYGNNGMSRALAVVLADKITKFEPLYEADTREREVMFTVWNFFPGGDTAAEVAEKIEKALS